MPVRLIVSLLVGGLAALPCTAAAARPELPHLLSAAAAGAALGSAPGGPASTAPAPAALPMVDRVSPLVLDVGDEITIAGQNFTPGALRNQLVFVRPGIRPVFVPVEAAESDEIRLRVPAKLLPFLRTENGKAVPTRFRITVLSQLFGPVFTPTALSPLVKPPAAGVAVPGAKDCDGDGVADTPVPEVIGLAVVGLGLPGVPVLGDELPDIPDVVGSPGVPDLPLPDDLPAQATPKAPVPPAVPEPGRRPTPVPPPTGGCTAAASVS